MTPRLIHFYSTQNVGDAAILAALERLVGGALPTGSAIDAGGPAPSDVLISPGGDIFNNGRPGLITRRFLNKLSQLRWQPERTVLFGQSIPPSCDGVALRLLARHLRRIASVTVRDPDSLARLAAFGVRARLSVDSAFALSPEDADITGAQRAFDRIGVSPDKAAVLSIRSFNRMYPVQEPRFLAGIEEICAGLQNAGFTPVIMLQAAVDTEDSDARIAARLGERIPHLRILDPFSGTQEPWRVALGVAGLAEAVIGTRYHSAVFRMVMGRVPVGLWYSCKGADLHDRFGIPGAHAGMFDPVKIVEAALGVRAARFDPAPLRAQVSADFEHALASIERRATAA